jgi:glycosyltransferase involved in cell wall biosynthesis
MLAQSKISIALCTYNGSRFLPQQLQSFLTQDRLPDELVVCDDASTDSTLQIIRDFAAASPFPLHIQVNDSNLGSTRNFEKAIRSCKGDLIFLADQDDVWDSAKLRIIENVFSTSPSVGLVFTDATLIDENSFPSGERLWDYTFPINLQKRARPNEFYKTLWSRNVVTGATAAFRRDLVDQILPVPLHIPNVIHDGWIALVISVCAEIAFLDKPLIAYRTHAGQQLGVRAPDKPTATAIEEFAWTIGNLRNQKVAFRALSERLQSNDSPRDNLAELEAELDEYIRHLEKRIELLNAGHVRRLPLILREVLSGRYHRYSRGLMSPLKDILNR